MVVKEKPGSLTRIPAKQLEKNAGDHAWCVSMFASHVPKSFIYYFFDLHYMCACVSKFSRILSYIPV